MYSGVIVDRAGGSESGVDCLVVDAMTLSAVDGEASGAIEEAVVDAAGVCSRVVVGGAWGSVR